METNTKKTSAVYLAEFDLRHNIVKITEGKDGVLIDMIFDRAATEFEKQIKEAFNAGFKYAEENIEFLKHPYRQDISEYSFASSYYKETYNY